MIMKDKSDLVYLMALGGTKDVPEASGRTDLRKDFLKRKFMNMKRDW
jgi:hypothetical protein